MEVTCEICGKTIPIKEASESSFTIRHLFGQGSSEDKYLFDCYTKNFCLDCCHSNFKTAEDFNLYMIKQIGGDKNE